MVARESTAWSSGRSGSSRQSSFVPYTITSRGRNSHGNSYDTRTQPGGLAYHYSNRDGSYYYRNSDGSLYYNRGNGFVTYTAPDGVRYDLSHYAGRTGNGHEADEDEEVEEALYEERYRPVENDHEDDRRFPSHLYDESQQSVCGGSAAYYYEASYRHEASDNGHDGRHEHERGYGESGGDEDEGVYEEEQTYACEGGDQDGGEYVGDGELEYGDVYFDCDDDGECSAEDCEYDYEDDGEYEDDDWYYDYTDGY